MITKRDFENIIDFIDDLTTSTSLHYIITETDVEESLGQIKNSLLELRNEIGQELWNVKNKKQIKN